jgi:hypothetical protein
MTTPLQYTYSINVGAIYFRNAVTDGGGLIPILNDHPADLISGSAFPISNTTTNGGGTYVDTAEDLATALSEASIEAAVSAAYVDDTVDPSLNGDVLGYWGSIVVGNFDGIQQYNTVFAVGIGPTSQTAVQDVLVAAAAGFVALL